MPVLYGTGSRMTMTSASYSYTISSAKLHCGCPGSRSVYRSAYRYYSCSTKYMGDTVGSPYCTGDADRHPDRVIHPVPVPAVGILHGYMRTVPYACTRYNVQDMLTARVQVQSRTRLVVLGRAAAAYCFRSGLIDGGQAPLRVDGLRRELRVA